MVQETMGGRSLPGWFKGVLLGLWGAARPARRADAPARMAPAAASAASAAPSAPAADAAAERSAAPALAPLAMLAAALRVPHGASPAELAAALARNRARTELDKELVDDRGFPIMTARCAGAADEAVRDMIAIWLAGEGMADLAFGDEQWRALTLASAVADELAAAAATLLPGDTEAAMPMLDLVALLPPSWSATQRLAAANWLRHRVAQGGWPRARIAPARGMPESVPLTPAAAFARLAHDAAAAAAPRVALVVACESAIGEDTIGRWTAEGVLLSASHSQGILPGEGAAGLLLADPRQARAGGGAAPTLSACVEGRRTTSADDTRRADPVLLLGLADRMLRHAGTAAPDVAMLVADTGHRTSRVLELAGCTASMLPHLDDTDDVVRAGLACGSCGVVPFMTALALGWHHARERAAPVVCVANEDAFARCVALVRPGAPQPDGTA